MPKLTVVPTHQTSLPSAPVQSRWREFRAAARECLAAFRYGMGNEKSYGSSMAIAGLAGLTITNSIFPDVMGATPAIIKAVEISSVAAMLTACVGAIVAPTHRNAREALNERHRSVFPEAPVSQVENRRNQLKIERPIAYRLGTMAPAIVGVTAPLIAKITLG